MSYNYLMVKWIGLIRWVRTYKRGYFIPTMMYHYHKRGGHGNHDPYTILYSHGNAVDLVMSLL
jgi:hypothetical protein